MAQRGQQVHKREGDLLTVPGARHPSDALSRLGTTGWPQPDQVIDNESQWRRAADSQFDLLLRVLEAQVLLAITKGHFQAPAAGIGLEDEGHAGPYVSREEGLVASSATGVADDDDAYRLVAEGHVPQGRLGEDLRGHGPTVQRQLQPMPVVPRGGPGGRVRQALAPPAGPAFL